MSPDGKLAATSGEKGKSILLLDVATGAVIRTLDGRANRFAFSADSGRIATWVRIDSPEVRVWDVATGDAIAAVAAGGEKQSVASVSLSTDGTKLATVGQDRSLRVWDVAKAKVAFTLAKDADAAGYVPFVDGSNLREVGHGKMRFWDAKTGRAIRPSIDAPSGSWSSGYRLSPTGDRLAVAHMCGVSEWETRTGRELAALAGIPDGPLYIAAFSADGRTAATAAYEQSVGSSVHLWDVATGKHLQRLDAGSRKLIWDIAVAGSSAVACHGAIGESLADMPAPLEWAVDRAIEFFDLHLRLGGLGVRNEVPPD